MKWIMLQLFYLVGITMHGIMLQDMLSSRSEYE